MLEKYPDPKPHGELSRKAQLSLLRLLDPAVLEDPYPFYRSLREHEPVHWDPYTHSWVVTSYPEVQTVLTTYSASRTPTPEQLERLGLSSMTPFAEVMIRQMLFMDDEAHTRLRTLCSRAFTPQRAQSLRATIQNIADQLIDQVIGTGRMDLIADFANPFPAIVTAALLGVPAEDHEQLKAWSADFAELLGNFQHNPDRVPQVLKSLEGLKAYVAAKMQDQRHSPSEGLIHSLMVAEVDGAHLTDEEVIANTIVTMIGGQETTTNLIGNGLLTLLRHPDALQLMRDDPSVLQTGVEELLRFESPSQHTARLAPADLELGGKQIKKGTAVMAIMAAANRDPRQFPEPDHLDLKRTNNRHVAFGWGAHFCFGAALARIEGQIAFSTLLRRLSDLRLATPRCEWRGNTGLRGLSALPLAFEPAADRAV